MGAPARTKCRSSGDSGRFERVHVSTSSRAGRATITVSTCQCVLGPCTLGFSLQCRRHIICVWPRSGGSLDLRQHHLGLLGDELLTAHGVRIRPDRLGVRPACAPPWSAVSSAQSQRQLPTAVVCMRAHVPAATGPGRKKDAGRGSAPAECGRGPWRMHESRQLPRPACSRGLPYHSNDGAPAIASPRQRAKGHSPVVDHDTEAVGVAHVVHAGIVAWASDA